MAGVATLQIDITADNKSAITGVREVKNNIDGLKESIKRYQDLAWNERDLGKLQTYNRELQSLQQQLKQTANAGKLGFDEMGVAIQKASGNPLSSAFSGLRQIAYILPGIGIAGIFNVAFEAIGKAAQAMGIFSTKASEAEKNLKNLNDVQKEADKQAGQDLTKARLLYQASTDVSLSMRERIKAAQELKNEYPELLKNFSNETIAAGGAKSAYDKLTDSIISNARAKAAAAKIGELQGKILDAQFKGEKIKNALENELQSAKSYNTGGEANTIITAEQQRQDSFNRAKKGFQELSKEIKSYTDQQEFLEKTIGKQALERGEIGLGKTTGLDKTTKEQDALKELSKTLGEIQHQYVKRAIDNDQYNKESIKAYDVALGKLDATSKKYDELIIKQGEYLRGNKIQKEDTVIAAPFTIDDLRKQRENRLKNDPDFVDKLGAAPKHISDSSKTGSGIFDDDFGNQADKKAQDFADLNKELKQAATLATFAGDAFTSLFSAMAQGENIGDAITKVFTDLVKQIAAAAIKALAFAIVLNVITGGAYSIGKIFAGAFGGNFSGKGYAKGGLATGPESGHMELLHGNEWVLRPEQLGGALSAARMAGAMEGGYGDSRNQMVEVVGVIRGNDIHLSQQRTSFQRGLTTGII